MSHSAKKSTARKGNPKAASRGAAVARARTAFHEAHDTRVWAMELLMYAELIGLPVGASRDEIAARLDNASLAELEAWTRQIEQAPGVAA